MAAQKIPLQLGFRMPAEWEPQAAIWLSWPHRKKTWPKAYHPIPAKFAEIAAAISRFEPVRFNVARSLHAVARRELDRAKADMSRIEIFAHSTDDAWCRDHGPIFVKNDRTGEIAITDWQFNAWGGKYPKFKADNGIPAKIAAKLGLRRFAHPMVLEGGSIEVDGKGALLTTEACLLNKNRNPDLSREQIERALREFLGVETIYWLGDGIEGDDTDGHVDDLSRFTPAGGIITAVESNAKDVNYRALRENLERLKSLRTPAGKKFKIIELPMPKPCFSGEQRLPATYANYLVLNGAVLMPAFRQKKRDAEAREILADCFPDREIVPIDCLDLVLGRGTLHCISQQQPA
ncbi:MAG: agmatine deiminase family protein [Nibricoccus sp.]